MLWWFWICIFLFFMHCFSVLMRYLRLDHYDRSLFLKILASGTSKIKAPSATWGKGVSRDNTTLELSDDGRSGREEAGWLLIASILRGFFPLALMMEPNSEDLTSWNYYICKEMSANNFLDHILTMANTLPPSSLLHLCLLLWGKNHTDPLLLFLTLFLSFRTAECLNPCYLEA